LSFKDDLAAMMDANGVNVLVSDEAIDGEDWPALLFTREDDQVTMPCRTIQPNHTTPLDLMLAAFLAIQHFEECDDFLEWIDLYKLDAGDNKFWDEFRELDAAQWQVQDLIGTDVFRTLMTGMVIEQAINMAWGGVVQSSQD
jgi:hypothetical protein